MITPPHTHTPRGWFASIIISQVNRHPKPASDYHCSCRLARLLLRRATVSQPDFSNFQVVAATEEHQSGTSLHVPKLIKAIESNETSKRILHQDKCW